jgi:hypothetical protein
VIDEEFISPQLKHFGCQPWGEAATHWEMTGFTGSPNANVHLELDDLRQPPGDMRQGRGALPQMALC